MAASPPVARGKRRGDHASESLARIVWVLVALLCEGVLDYNACLDRFGIDKRAFQRDLKKLREIGKTCGWEISNAIRGRIHLIRKNHRIGRVCAKSGESLDTLIRVARALGGPVEYSLLDAVPQKETGDYDGFLHLREPQPVDGAAIQPVFEFLKKAAASSAQVEFSYKGARGPRAMRRVDPYHVVVRSGRAYLVAYDCERRGWRQFALDAIGQAMTRAGTFRPRPVPAEYLENAVGWIRSGPSLEVTVRFTPLVAAAVLARRWNEAQRVRSLPEGGAELSMTVGDLGEAVRWAMQFGPEAIVVEPPRAVELARELAQQLVARYGDTHASRRADTLSA